MNHNSISEWLNGWRLRLLIVSIVLAATGYISVSLWVGWEDVSAAVVRIGPMIICLSLLLSLLNYGLRFVRWELYLRQLSYTIVSKTNISIYLSGFALTTTPAKAGEALRAVLLKPYGVRYSDSLAALLSERVSDLLAVLIMAAIGISQYPQYEPLIWIFALLIPAFWLLIASKKLLNSIHIISIRLPAILAKIAEKILQILETTRRCHPPLLIVQASILSLIAWGAEGVAFYAILQQLQSSISLETALFIYATAMLAGAASFMPGGLGGAELAMTGLLHLNGMPVADAIAASLVIRLATLWFAVVLGLIFLTQEIRRISND